MVRRFIDVDERRDELIRRYQEHEPVKSLLADARVSAPVFYKRLKAWGIPNRGHVAFAESIRMPLDRARLGYIAGIIDGEGTISILRPPGKRTRVTVQVASTTRALHDWLLEEVGGKVYERVGLNHLGTRPIWYWHLVRMRDVRMFLSAIEPFMIIKRSLANDALEALGEG